MKRLILTIVAAAAVGAAAFSIADAQGPGRRGPDGQRFRGPGSAFGIARLADLTDEQRQKVREILESERANGQAPEEPMTLRRQLHAELLADSPDDQKIQSLRQQILDATANALTREISVQRQIAQVLTAEQRAKVRERLSAEHHRGFRQLP